ncbi:putative immunity protein [Nitrosomonas sp.]|uniref:putative immunity protein n=1 Tax=Nitrosomonas sp. TaxID=42353 RepID=UPI0025EC751B|nr:hypothetical protein [Nitrosomonas sp.]
MTLYKILDADRRGPISGVRWPQLKRWTPRVDRLERCVSGWHVIPGEEALQQRLVEPGVIYAAEIDEDLPVLRYDDEWVASRARLLELTRWDARRARLFAADCAAHVHHIWADRYPDDDRPAEAIAVARAYAMDEATVAEMDARAAAWAAYAARDAAAAARDAAAAARAAAWAAYAARDAAWDAERAWQAERLRRYLWDAELPEPLPLPERALR